MGPGGVVIGCPGRDLGAGMAEAEEQVFVQEFIPHAAVEGFNKGVLDRLAAMPDAVKRGPNLDRPQHNGLDYSGLFAANAAWQVEAKASCEEAATLRVELDRLKASSALMGKVPELAANAKNLTKVQLQELSAQWLADVRTAQRECDSGWAG